MSKKLEKYYTMWNRFFSEIPEGPWSSEPHYSMFYEKITNYPCLLTRGAQGIWCGYVGLDKSNDFYGRDLIIDYSELAEKISVHGGITFSGQFDSEKADTFSDDNFNAKDFWWIGFDFGHAFDYYPAYLKSGINTLMEGQSIHDYRNFNYAKLNAISLALQLRVLSDQSSRW